jgi:lantibiotic biosynthesis protein
VSHDRAIRILDDIDRTLGAALDEASPPGLLDGSSGVALFHAYQYRRTGDDRHLDAAVRLLTRVIEVLSTEALHVSHCAGIGGIAWCLQHLVHQGLVDLDGAEDAIFEQVDQVLGAALIADLERGRRDFLHDGAGAILYLVGRLPAPAARASLEAALEILIRTSTTDEAGARWAGPGGVIQAPPGEPVFNLGLAHGVPGILALISILHENGIGAGGASPTLRAGARWLRAARRAPDRGCASLYPTIVDAGGDAIGPRQSRLGWCYGDLGVATALLHLGRALGDGELVDEAADILRHTLAHRTADSGDIEDAALCHGSMGVSQIFRRAYLATGDRTFLDGAERWLRHGLDMARWPDGAAGFKSRMRSGFESSHALLTGIAGIGLALIAALGPPEASAWDRCLLIS